MKHMKKLLVLALVVMSVMAIAVPALATTTKYVSVSQGPGHTVNLRASASLNSAILDQPTYGSAIYVTSSGSTWSAVTYYNPVTEVTYNGYIMSQYLVSSIPTDCYWIVRYGTIDHKYTDRWKAGCEELQTDLNTELGLSLVVDGICGNNTVAAIRSFQSQNNLVVDGVAGNRTKEYLYKLR